MAPQIRVRTSINFATLSPSQSFLSGVVSESCSTTDDGEPTGTPHRSHVPSVTDAWGQSGKPGLFVLDGVVIAYAHSSQHIHHKPDRGAGSSGLLPLPPSGGMVARTSTITGKPDEACGKAYLMALWSVSTPAATGRGHRCTRLHQPQSRRLMMLGSFISKSHQ